MPWEFWRLTMSELIELFDANSDPASRPKRAQSQAEMMAIAQAFSQAHPPLKAVPRG